MRYSLKNCFYYRSRRFSRFPPTKTVFGPPGFVLRCQIELPYSVSNLQKPQRQRRFKQ